jgi:hypothetical protein
VVAAVFSAKLSRYAVAVIRRTYYCIYVSCIVRVHPNTINHHHPHTPKIHNIFINYNIYYIILSTYPAAIYNDIIVALFASRATGREPIAPSHIAAHCSTMHIPLRDTPLQDALGIYTYIR